MKHAQPYICQALFCKVNISSDECFQVDGAANGTICDIGSVNSYLLKYSGFSSIIITQICKNRQCVLDERVIQDNCPFGDGIVENSRAVAFALEISNPITCTEAIEKLLQSNIDPVFLCKNTWFPKTCCKTCNSK